MRTPTMLLLLLGIVVARGEESSDKVNQLETRNVPQVAKPNGLDTASTRNGEMQIAHLQYQPNRMENRMDNRMDSRMDSRMDNQDMKFQQLSQMQNPQSNMQNQVQQFYSQNQATQMRTQDLNQLLQAQNQAQFYNQADAQLRQFRHQTQMQTGTPPARQEQEMSTLVQPQERMTAAPVSTTQPTTQTPKEQTQNIAERQMQQLYSGDVVSEQPIQFYQDRRSMVDAQDTSSERRFDEAPRQQQNQIMSNVQTAAARSGGFQQVFPQRSAFDNRQQPIVLPGVSQTHSTSVVVSGLKNLPVLPALVYSAAPVPSSHAVAYGRPWFQGGAYIKQHFQTPYARYVYSHIL